MDCKALRQRPETVWRICNACRRNDKHHWSRPVLLVLHKPHEPGAAKAAVGVLRDS